MRTLSAGMLLLLLLCLQGCSGRAWYDGLKQAQASECAKLQDAAREDCLRDAGVGYDAYRRERRETINGEGESPLTGPRVVPVPETP